MLSITAQSLRPRQEDVCPSNFLNVPPVSRRGFTLIELLTVIAIIGILSAITFGVVKGVNERAAIGQARAELGALSQSLEAYKRQYGDYPQTGDNATMIQSLIGKLGPKNDPIPGKSFIDVAQFTFNDSTKSPYDTATLTITDPWGRNYAYLYKTSSSWVNPSYVLYCYGPNGISLGTSTSAAASAIIDATGILKSTAATDSGAADNIYYNK